MINKVHKGAEGEEIALSYLLKRGYVLLERNWRFLRKEIDLIMRQGDMIIFVEVKARSTGRYGLAREAVGSKKQQSIAIAANGYMQKHGMNRAARFDVIEVNLRSGEVTHLENAFMDNW